MRVLGALKWFGWGFALEKLEIEDCGERNSTRQTKYTLVAEKNHRSFSAQGTLN